MFIKISWNFLKNISKNHISFYTTLSSITKLITINNEIEQNKAQYNLDRETAKFSDLLSGNISKYKFMNRKDGLPQKHLLEKSIALKRFVYSLFGKELKKQTGVSEKRVKIRKEEPLIIVESSLFYTFNEFKNVKKMSN